MGLGDARPALNSELPLPGWASGNALGSPASYWERGHLARPDEEAYEREDRASDNPSSGRHAACALIE